jgi:hypothetical protein
MTILEADDHCISYAFSTFAQLFKRGLGGIRGFCLFGAGLKLNPPLDPFGIPERWTSSPVPLARDD